MSKNKQTAVFVSLGILALAAGYAGYVSYNAQKEVADLREEMEVEKASGGNGNGSETEGDEG